MSGIFYAFGEQYAVLVMARSVQGIGSAFSSVAGMGLLASKYPDDLERGQAMGIAIGGIALGVIAGPPFGGILYDLCGKEVPLLILAGLALFDGLLQLSALQLGVQPEQLKGTPLKDLLTDPYILVAAGSLTVSCMGIATLDAILPLRMMDVMNAPTWQQGAIYLPANGAYLICSNIFGTVAFKIGRWLSAMIGLVLLSISLFAIPFCTTFVQLLAPVIGWGISVGIVDSAIMPTMGQLVDLRHVPVYGSVYAIVGVAYCIGMSTAASISGLVVRLLGFKWMLWMLALINFVYAPLMLFLRNPPKRTENSYEPLQ